MTEQNLAYTYEFIKHDGGDQDCQHIRIKLGEFTGVVYSYSRIGYNELVERIEVGYNIHESNGINTDCDDWHELVYDIATHIILIKETIEELNDVDMRNDIEEI
jgi:hypothetical protein